MIRERVTGIFANLLLEIESQGHLTSKDSAEILAVLNKKWKE